MKVWPSDSFIIQSSAPIGELIDALRAYTETPRKFYRPEQRREFRGIIGPTGFRISLTRSKSRGFNPIVIRGKFEQHPTSTTVRVWIAYPQYIIAPIILTFFLVLTLVTAYSLTRVNGLYIAIPFVVAFPVMQGVALWIILLAVFWADAGHSRRLLEYLLLQPKVAIQSSVRHNASESHRRRAVTDYITVIALLCFVVGFIARWIQHGQSNVWLDVVAAIAGTFFILVFFIGRLYAAFPLKSELRNPRVRKWAAMPAVILITILVGLLLIYLIGEWSLVLMGAGKQ